MHEEVAKCLSCRGLLYGALREREKQEASLFQAKAVLDQLEAVRPSSTIDAVYANLAGNIAMMFMVAKNDPVTALQVGR